MEVLAVHQLKKRRIKQEKEKKERELREQIQSKEDQIDQAEINQIFGLPSPPSEIFALGRDSSCALWWTYDKELLAKDDDIILDKIDFNEEVQAKPSDDSSRHSFSALNPSELSTSSSITNNTTFNNTNTNTSATNRRRSSLLSNLNETVSNTKVKLSKKKKKELEEELLLKKKLQEEKEEREIQEILDAANNKDELKVTGWEILRYRKDPVKDLSRLSPEDSLLVSFNTVTGYGIWRLKGRTRILKASQTQVIIENLTNNYEYYFQICAINKKGIGIPSKSSNVIFIEKELPLNWYRYYDKKLNKIFYTSIKSNRIYYEKRPEDDPYFLHDDLYLQFVKVNDEDSDPATSEEHEKESEDSDEDSDEYSQNLSDEESNSDTSNSNTEEDNFSNSRVEKRSKKSKDSKYSDFISLSNSLPSKNKTLNKKDQKLQKLKENNKKLNNEKELNLLRSLFDEEMVLTNGVISCDRMLTLLQNELNFQDISKKYLLELFYIYNKYNNKNFYYQKFNALSNNKQENNPIKYHDNMVKQSLTTKTSSTVDLTFNKPDFTVITTWIEFIEIILQIKIKTKKEIKDNNDKKFFFNKNKDKKIKLRKIISKSLKKLYKNLFNIDNIKYFNIFYSIYMYYKQFYLHNTILTYNDGEKYGSWIKKYNSFIDKNYYENILTGEIVWYLPNEIRFFLPKNLEKMLLKKFNYGQLNEFKKYFILFDIDNNGDLSFEEVKILFKKFIFRKNVNNNDENNEEYNEEKLSKFSFFSYFFNKKHKNYKKIKKDKNYLSDEKLKELIKTVDKNNNGTIEFNEFCWMLYEIASKDEFVFNFDANNPDKESIGIFQQENEKLELTIEDLSKRDKENLASMGKIGEKLSHSTPLPLLPTVSSSIIQSHLDPIIDHSKSRRKSLLSRASSNSNSNFYNNTPRSSTPRTPRRGSVTSIVSSSSNSNPDEISLHKQAAPRKRSVFNIFASNSTDSHENSIEASTSIVLPTSNNNSPTITAKNRKKLIPLFQQNATIVPEIISYPAPLSLPNGGSYTPLDLTLNSFQNSSIDKQEEVDALSAIYEESTVVTAEN